MRRIIKKKIDITEYNYYSDKITADFEQFKLAVISDLHTNELGINSCNLIAKIDEVNPDAIIIAGDMLSDNAKRMHVTYKLLNALTKKYEIYYACGNHELKLGTNPRSEEKYKEYRKKFRKAGVHYLNNKTDYICKGNSKIHIAGLNIARKYYTKIWNRKQNIPEGYIESLVGKPGGSESSNSNAETLSILIAHNPIYFDSYASWGADIIFSGHVHGGMMVLPRIGGVISSSFELFPKYDFGEFNKINELTGHKSTMYLTRGQGSHTIPLRINNNPEIMVVTLNSCKNNF